MGSEPEFEVIEHTLIPLPDGIQLAARIWIPRTPANEATVFPTVLEYLPYRKRDGTAARDESNFPWFARAGIAGVRVDLCGHGESDGVFDDEYSPRELDHGVEVINWIAQQPWSNGNVGMMGISWGGFNGMQIAAMKPEALKAVISVGTTVDRYNDDIHYKNGCHLDSDFYWSNMMLTYAARPPDPVLREDWKAVWKKRLEEQPFPLPVWLQHQRRDDYWKHGSVCEDYASYTIPTLIIGGWADHYKNAPPALVEHANTTVKAVNGPWIHKYPHFAWPRPRMDFHREAIAWWKYWLEPEGSAEHETAKQIVENLPAYRAFVASAVRPGVERRHENGRWVACEQWPQPDDANQSERSKTLFLSSVGELNMGPSKAASVSICSPQDCGIGAGERFTLAPDADIAGDQRFDDGGSLVFRTAELDEAIEVLGRPRLQVPVAIDRTLGNLCVRLIDVHPDGLAHRVSYGVINLAHRDGNEHPIAMTPGKSVDVSLLLDECAYRFEPGHRIQLSISTAYWPAIQPPPEVVTATFELGESSSLILPLVAGATDCEIPEPGNQNLFPEYPLHMEDAKERSVMHDLQNGITRYRTFADTGLEEIPEHGMQTRHLRDETWSIKPDDPLSATAEGLHTWWSVRGDWNIRIEITSRLTCDKEAYFMSASIKAWIGEEQFNEREWDARIERDFT